MEVSIYLLFYDFPIRFSEFLLLLIFLNFNIMLCKNILEMTTMDDLDIQRRVHPQKQRRYKTTNTPGRKTISQKPLEILQFTHHVLCTTNRILKVRFHGVYSHFQQFFSYIVTTKHEWKTWIVILNCVKGRCLETLILGVGIKAGTHVNVVRLADT